MPCHCSTESTRHLLVPAKKSHPGRFLNPHLKVPEMKALLYAPEIVRWGASCSDARLRR